MPRGEAVIILPGEIDGPDNAGARRLKLFRLDAVSAPASAAHGMPRTTPTSSTSPARSPTDVFHEDAKLLMWYNQASTRATDPQT